MRVFVYDITSDPADSVEEVGYVRAETAEMAVALIGHPEANVYHLPADAEWPGDPDRSVCRWARVPELDRRRRIGPGSEAVRSAPL